MDRVAASTRELVPLIVETYTPKPQTDVEFALAKSLQRAFPFFETINLL